MASGSIMRHECKPVRKSQLDLLKNSQVYFDEYMPPRLPAISGSWQMEMTDGKLQFAALAPVWRHKDTRQSLTLIIHLIEPMHLKSPTEQQGKKS